MGLSLLAIKSDVDAASDVGVSSTRLQDLVLFLSGSTMGLCGGFYASYFSYIEPGDMFGFDRSISWVLMGVIGGIGTIAGPALGAVIFGVFEAAGFRLGSSGVPSQLVQMLPYLVVVISLTLVAVRRELRVRERARAAAA